MKFSFTPQARQDVRNAIEFYEARRLGWGSEFLKELRATLGYVCQFPNGGTRMTSSLRRWRIKRFPYAVVYRHEGQQVIVAVVMHLLRKPGYWK